MRSVLAVAVAVSFLLQTLIGGTALAQQATPAPTASPALTPVAAAPAVSAPVATTSTQRKGEDVITPMGALWRSTLVPGWGQRYKGEKKKGWLFTGVAGGMAAATLASFQISKDAQRAYDNLDAQDDPGDFDQKHEAQVNTAVVFQMVAGFTAALWAVNIADSAFTPLEHLRIKDARVKDVFPAISKYYENSPIATISVENRSSEPVTKVRLKFEAKDIMDAPAESVVIDTIPPGLGKSISVTAAFSERIFDVGRSEPKSVPAKITIEYEVGKKKRSVTRTATFTVYNRNAIVWDDMRKLASFVTPREEGVKEFASAVAVRKVNISSVKNISTAAAFFDGLSASGMTYVSDPQAPFAYFDGNAEAVDGVNYPRETLNRRTGDCDDLTALYASLLESAGIPTALVDVPGHVFLMFDSGLTPEEMRGYTGNDAEFMSRNGAAWIPVEVTAVGKSFRDAWKIGAQGMKKFSGLNQMNLVDVTAAQAEYPPLPPAFGPTGKGFAEFDMKKFMLLAKADHDELFKREERNRTRLVADIKGRNLPKAAEENEVGIAFAKDGKLDQAILHFKAALVANPQFAKAHNNLGNVYYLRGNSAEAKKSYQAALQTGGDNAAILANLAQMFYDEGDARQAKSYFERAVKLEPIYERDYPEFAALLRDGGSKVATAGGGSSGKAAGVGVAGKDPRKSLWTR